MRGSPLLHTVVKPRSAIFFPGQGIEYPGMLSGLLKSHPSLTNDGLETLYKALKSDEVPDAFNQISGLLTTENPTPQDEKLIHRTSISQPAIMLSSIITLQLANKWAEMSVELKDERPRIIQETLSDCTFMFGHSLGQVIAYVSAGVISLLEGLKIVRERGLAMESAANDTLALMNAESASQFGMISVPIVGETVAQFVDKFTEKAKQLKDNNAIDKSSILDVALMNSPKQVVVSGHVAALETVLEEMKRRRTTKLPVRIPFHSSLLRSTEQRMRNVVSNAGIEYNWPPRKNIKIIENYSLNSIESVDGLKDSIVKGCWEPVNWVGAVDYLNEKENVSTWIGIGAGSSVSAGLVEATLGKRKGTVISIDPLKSTEGWRVITR
ncbi:acyl transferase/acyl hydrolase/lysophospholipase [Lipomyces arxii]|uniref:acyl transferase/acyl hydrolase/lysophospholipase n=1 Tax=Lipomyces arxii TaxID=56418 RepID=UPI0034CE3BEB